MKNTILWVAGGVLAGGGLLTGLRGGFGYPGGDVALQFSKMGFDGIDDLAIGGQGWAAIALFLVGVALMATASSGAWRETGGY